MKAALLSSAALARGFFRKLSETQGQPCVLPRLLGLSELELA